MIRGELSDGQLSTPFKFSVTVTNDPPDFESQLYDQVAYLGEKSTYQLPEVIDPEGLKFNIKVAMRDVQKLPPFIKYTKGALTFIIPDDPSLLKSQHFIKFTLDDGYSKPTERTLKLTIENPPAKSVRNGAILTELKIVSITKDQMITVRIIG